MIKKIKMIKLLSFSLCFVGSSICSAQVWVDSTGSAISDTTALADRTGRGGMVTTAPAVGFDAGDIVVLPEEVSNAISDMSHLFNGRDEITARCTIPAKTVSVYECPSNADANCYRKLTHQSWKTVGAGGDGRIRFKRGGYSWGLNLYRRSSDYKWYQDYVSPVQNLDGPGDFVNPLVLRSITVPAKHVDVTLSKTKGYRVRYDGRNLLSDEWHPGDLSSMTGWYFDGRIISNYKIANYPRILKPKYDISFVDSNGTVYSRFYTTLSDKGGPKYGYIKEQEGFRALYGAGKLADRFLLKSISHITSAGKYQNRVVMSLENTWVFDGNNYKTFFAGHTKEDKTVLVWKGVSKSNTAWANEVTSADVSNTAPATTPVKPFQYSSLDCAFQ